MPNVRLAAALAAVGLGLSAPAVGSAAAVAPPPTKGVVLVTTNLAYENASAAGTGIVLTRSGEILTNNHVIRGATTITVVVPKTKRRYAAQVVGYDIVDDIALLQLTNGAGLATATRGDSSKLRVGQPATAVGNANGAGRLVVTKGRITGLARSITVSDDQGGTTQLSGLIQTSARLVPGDSGGPLLDAAGRVVGVDAAGSPNYALEASDGFAIPINRAYGLAKAMEAGQASAVVHIGKTGFLGISVANANGAGVTVGSVVDGGPAAAAGLAQGDVITAVDGQPVASLVDLRAALFAHHPGDSVDIAYTDALGQPASASVLLGDGPPQ